MRHGHGLGNRQLTRQAFGVSFDNRAKICAAVGEKIVDTACCKQLKIRLGLRIFFSLVPACTAGFPGIADLELRHVVLYLVSAILPHNFLQILLKGQSTTRRSALWTGTAAWDRIGPL